MRIIPSVCAILAFLAPTWAHGGDLPASSFPPLPRTVKQPADFVPAGWRLIAVTKGDLNGDAIDDVAVLMRMTSKANIKPVTGSSYYRFDDTNPYRLAIGFAQNGGYTLAATHHALFPQETAPMHGDDAPDKGPVTIRRNVLSLSFGHLRGQDLYRFRWNGKGFALIGWECSGVVSDTVMALSANYLTHKARQTRGSISSDKEVVSMLTIRPAKPAMLDSFNIDSDWAGQDSKGNPLSC